MPTTPFFVLTPTFNREARLRRAIDSVLAQGYEHWELFVVDDGSTDGTPETLKKVEPHPRIHTHRLEQNGGVNRARNRLLERILATGREGVIAFLDDDDFYVPDCLERMAREAERRPSCQWFVANAVELSGERLTRVARYGALSYIRDHKFGRGLRGDFAHFVRTGAVGDLRFSTRFRNSEEWYFFLKLARSHDLFAVDFDAVVKERLPDGLGRLKPNRGRKREVLELKLETLEGALSDRELCRARAKLARLMAREGEPAEALRLLRECRQQNPRDPLVYAGLLEAALRLPLTRGRAG